MKRINGAGCEILCNAMGESTCVMHAFSYMSGISTETNEGNPLYGLGESVSFGRFMTETLSWEKWSAFTRNRYVDEAKSYSTPGSVAQKKAYFEAHFKRMAALKAAALLEQQATNNNNNISVQDGSQRELHAQVEVNNGNAEVVNHDSELLAQEMSMNPQSEANDQESVQIESESSGLTDNHNEPIFEAGANISSVKDVEGEDQAAQVEATRDLMDANQESVQIERESSGQTTNPSFDVGENLSSIKNVDGEDQAAPVLARDLMDANQESVRIDGESPGVTANLNEPGFDAGDNKSGIKNVGQDQAAHVGLTRDLMGADQEGVWIDGESSVLTANHNEPSFDAGENESSIKNVEGEDQAAQVGPTRDLMDAKKCSSSINIDWGVAKAENSLLQNFASNQELLATLPVIKKNPLLSSFIPSIGAGSSVASSSSPVRSVASQVIHPGKENFATPTGRKSWINETDKRRTPLRMSINREINRLISPVIKKIGSSSKASGKDCFTPFMTAAKASVDGVRGLPSETSQSGRRRARALFDSSAVGSKTVGPRWQFLSAEGSISPNVSRNKTSSPMISTFYMRSRDRTQKRKENLEEKFNAKAAEKGRQQSKPKGKATEINKLRQSFCFGARLSSEIF